MVNNNKIIYNYEYDKENYRSIINKSLNMKKQNSLDFKEFIFKDELISTKSIEGYLLKKSIYLFRGWQEKYLILNNNELKYYKSKESEKEFPLGSINFNFITVKILQEKYWPIFTILTENPTKYFYFKCNNMEEQKLWIDVLKNNIRTSKGNKQSLSLKLNKFWKYCYINYDNLCLRCDTGDLLLFKSKHFGAKLQRILTQHNFDHVAIIIKKDNKNIFILESLGETGVAMIKYSDFLKNDFQNFYDNISYRPLKIKRNEEFYKRVNYFIDRNLGKKYDIKISKLIKKSTENKIENGIHEKETYFCSELVASFYKSIQAINIEKSSSNYLPGNFSLKNKLNYLNDCKLLNQYRILFN